MKQSGIEFRKKRKLNYMHLKVKQLVQKPQLVTLAGLGSSSCNLKIPYHMNGQLGFLAS